MRHVRYFSTRQLLNVAVAATKVLAPSTVFEVGAREAIYLRSLCDTDAKLVAFEASRANYDRFGPEVRDACPRAEYKYLAVAERTGSVQFHVNTVIGGRPADEYTGRNSILDRRQTTTHTTVNVPCVALSDYIETEGLEGRYAMWIDVEGATGAVLMGLREYLDAVDLIHVEVEIKPYWRGQWLEPEVLRYCHDHGLVLVARDRESRYQYNCLLVRVDRIGEIEHLLRS